MMIMMIVSASLENICHRCGNPLLAHVWQLAWTVGQRDVCAMCYNCRTARCSLLSSISRRTPQCPSTHKLTHRHSHRFDVNGGRRCGRDFYFRTLQWRIKFFLMPARVWKTKTIIRQRQQQQQQQRKQSQSSNNKIEENQKKNKSKKNKRKRKTKARQGRRKLKNVKRWNFYVSLHLRSTTRTTRITITKAKPTTITTIAARAHLADTFAYISYSYLPQSTDTFAALWFLYVYLIYFHWIYFWAIER